MNAANNFRDQRQSSSSLPTVKFDGHPVHLDLLFIRLNAVRREVPDIQTLCFLISFLFFLIYQQH